MSIHCGTDIIEIERIRDAIDRDGGSFVKRVYTEQEVAYCESRGVARYMSYAARFSAKEAVAKAFGTGIGSRMGLKDIEVVHDETGAPQIRLGGKALETYREMGVKSISLSISHCKTYATACVVLERE